MDDLIETGALHELFDRIDDADIALTGDGGFLTVTVKAVLERGLQFASMAPLIARVARRQLGLPQRSPDHSMRPDHG